MRRSPVSIAQICCTAALAAGVAAPAAAQQQTVTLEGDAEQICSLGAPSVADGAQANFDTPAGAVFAITSLADPVTLTTRAARITLSLDAMCNAVHRLVVVSDNNGLWRQGAASSAAGFGSAVPFRADVTWVDAQDVLNADAVTRRTVERSVLIDKPGAGALLIDFTVLAGATNAGVGAPLLAGDYADVLRVTLEPQ